MSFWSLVTDVEKQIFANDKFLAQASNDGICRSSAICASVYVKHFRVVGESFIFFCIQVVEYTSTGFHQMLYRSVCHGFQPTDGLLSLYLLSLLPYIFFSALVWAIWNKEIVNVVACLQKIFF